MATEHVLPQKNLDDSGTGLLSSKLYTIKTFPQQVQARNARLG